MQKFSSYLSGVNTLLTSIATFIVLGFLVFILNNPELVDEFATFWRELIANYFAGYLIWVVTLVTVFNIFIAFTHALYTSKEFYTPPTMISVRSK